MTFHGFHPRAMPVSCWVVGHGRRRVVWAGRLPRRRRFPRCPRWREGRQGKCCGRRDGHQRGQLV